MEGVVKRMVVVGERVGSLVEGMFGYFVVRNGEDVWKWSVVRKIGEGVEL